MRIEIDGIKFILRLDAEDHPYILKRWQWNEPRSRQYWATVWASWHKGMPTGIRMRAIEAMGFHWDRSFPGCRWERLT